MPSVYEIRKLARQVDNARQVVKSKKNGMMSEVYQISSWWNSSASASFISTYKDIDSDIESLCKKLDNLEYYLKNLANKLETAELERKMAAIKARK